MRDLLKIFLVGAVFFFSSQAFAEESYKVLVIPDNIVTENIAVDSYIYNASAEFFADGIITILDGTDYIKSPTVSETRNLIKNDTSSMLSTKNVMNRFRSSYNVDYVALKKLAKKTNSQYVLLITSYIDAENYILRRTLWDFLNIPGATVVDPAYKISTYAVLVDTNTNTTLWSDTFYKTISVCENRIITRGTSPQTEQLQKIRDYSRLLCPQIAEQVQHAVLPADTYADESRQVKYDSSNIDNVFTKKYRSWKKDTNTFYNDTKTTIQEKREKAKQRAAERKLAREEAKQAELELKQEQLEVKAEPIYKKEIKENIKGITNIVKPQSNINNNIREINYYEPIDIKKTRKNSLYGDSQSARPSLRDYNN